MNLEGWRRQLRAVRRSEDINKVFRGAMPTCMVWLWGSVRAEAVTEGRVVTSLERFRSLELSRDKQGNTSVALGEMTPRMGDLEY
jgi:hypothetical protein